MSKLQNNFTTPGQSKRLLELGVPADSADCIYYDKGLSPSTLIGYKGNQFLYSEMKESEDYIPCWSVGRLMEIFHICIPNTSIYGWSYHEDVDGSYIDYIIQEYVDAYGELDFSKLEE